MDGKNFTYDKLKENTVYVDWHCTKTFKMQKNVYQSGCIVLDTVKTAIILGVEIDECLTWSVLIDFLCKKLSKKIGILCRLRTFMSKCSVTDNL